MNQKNQLLIIIAILLISISLVYIKKTQKNWYETDEWAEKLKKATPRPQVPDWAQPNEEKPPQPPQKIEPEWKDYPAVRSVTNLGKVLSDIDSHMPAGHIYKDSDKITWGHETLHGISSNIRQKYSQGFYGGFKTIHGEPAWKTLEGIPVFHNGQINGFYCLDNKAVIIAEPKTTISATAALVPTSLRGGVYSLYLVQQASSWNNTPLYILDEWNAYTGGSLTRKDLNIAERSETVQYMIEFDVYATALAMSIKKNDPNYDDKQFKNFLMWNIERSMSILNNEAGAVDYLEKFKKNQDAQSLRDFAKNYFGEQWCHKYFGI